MENNENNAVNAENNGTQPSEQKEVKTFTQEEVNEMIKTRLRNIPSKSELDEFKTWKESQKTEQDKLNELQTNNNNLTNELNTLKAQIKVNESDVKKEFSKFVTTEVMSLVNDTTDFATALKDYKKNNPQYFGEVVIKKVQSSPALNGGGNQPQTTNSIMNNLLRGNL